MSLVVLFATSETHWCISVVRWVRWVVEESVATCHPGGTGWEGVVCGCICSVIVSPSFITTCCIGCVGHKLSSRGCTCSFDYWIVYWWLALTIVTGCSSCWVEMMYGIRVEVNASLCLSALVSCCGVCVLDWGPRVQAEEVVLWSLWWSCCSCLLFSDSSFLFFLLITFSHCG